MLWTIGGFPELVERHQLTAHRIPRVLAFLILSFGGATSWAQRAYAPPVSIERDHQTYVVNGDGTHIKSMENSFRIRTPKGAEDNGSQEISYISSQEEILSVDAWTITRDGTRIPVPPSAIRDREEDNSGGVAEFSDTKIKAIIFPRVAVGSLTSYKVVSRVHATPYPGEFTAGFVFSPSFVFSDWEAQFVLPESKKLHVDKRGVTGGLDKTVDGLSYYTFRYRR